MNSGKAKKIRREARQLATEVIYEYHIKVFADGNASIEGPIDNLLIYRDVMNKVERAVLNRFAQGERSRIVVPKIGVVQ